ncbi:MAG TPA: excinuclease ABC subunit UvrC [Bacteroidales bacterium]|nr:excinuclease ABC subunit C [Bacteroidales bacterium]HOU96068.1 excinuclease ABC subunit UvrC [Bacteroidales bacterium]HQG36971.1 excinuclease ABC subunit UvrC [Bacteroidales bacterium]HQG52207.1 excinuclease ABC subunit UvrC [Bacteroidales bacterium]HQJ19993.1 excinuclease ABC subunit UvrC [Bacteroidales bacterium]
MTLKHELILPNLPDNPGIYQFIDSFGKIIYVGKARNLKKRVSSYFTKKQSGKTRVMLQNAAELRYIITDNESDALLLENNLIKKYQPRYNILLKDDKTFPWICIKNEPFPRVFLTRKQVRDGSDYFGPYTSVAMVKTILELVRRLYPLRTCNYNLTQENINAGKFKICLEYHLGNCSAPCIGKQTKEEYNKNISQTKDILKGNISSVIEYLQGLMNLYSKELRFEEAQKVKEKIEILSKYRSKSAIVSSTIRNVDVFGYSEENGKAYISYLRVSNGAVIQTYTLEIVNRLNETKDNILGMGITEIRLKTGSESKEIIVPFLPDILMKDIKYTVPEIGDKHKLLELAQKNAKFYCMEQLKRKEGREEENRTERNLEKVKKDLYMTELPMHIECFDNSNIMGKNPVAACVVFRNGRPSKKEYRHYNIKTVKGPDDYSSMEEVIYRRYHRLTEENQELPQLVIIDGGKGQLNSALKSIEKLNLKNKMTVIGIAKKLEEIYFPGDSIPYYLDKDSYTLKLIRQIRNEAHRFGITFHREKRSADMVRSSLDDIKGIGPKTRELLLNNFNSIDEIKSSSYEKLKDIVGHSKAKLLTEYFNKY